MSGLEASDHDASWAVCIIRTAPSAPLIFHPVHAEFTGHTRRLPQRGKKLSPQHSSGPSIWRKRRKRENSSHKGSGSPREGSRESDLVVCAGREGRECMLALLPMHTLPLHLSHQIHVTTPGSVRVHEGHFSTLESRQCHQRIRHTSNTAICQRGPYIVFFCFFYFVVLILSLPSFYHWHLCPVTDSCVTAAEVREEVYWLSLLLFERSVQINCVASKKQVAVLKLISPQLAVVFMSGATDMLFFQRSQRMPCHILKRSCNLSRFCVCMWTWVWEHKSVSHTEIYYSFIHSFIHSCVFVCGSIYINNVCLLLFSLPS